MKDNTKFSIIVLTIAGMGLLAIPFTKCVMECKRERWHQENQHMEAEVKKYIDSTLENRLDSPTTEQRGGN